MHVQSLPHPTEAAAAGEPPAAACAVAAPAGNVVRLPHPGGALPDERAPGGGRAGGGAGQPTLKGEEQEDERPFTVGVLGPSYLENENALHLALTETGLDACVERLVSDDGYCFSRSARLATGPHVWAKTWAEEHGLKHRAVDPVAKHSQNPSYITRNKRLVGKSDAILLLFTPYTRMNIEFADLIVRAYDEGVPVHIFRCPDAPAFRRQS